VSEFEREQPSQEPEVAMLRLRLTVPTLVQRLDERLLASHVRDVVAVGQAYLERRIKWPALLVGLEAAFFQARACMVDEEAGEALVAAAEAVARYAGAAMGRMAGAGAEDPEAPVMGVAQAGAATPSDSDSEHPDSQAGPATLPSVMSSGAQRSRDICPRPLETSDSRPDPSTSLGVTRGASEADSERPESESGTGFALSVSNTKANPKVQISYPKPKPYPKPKTEGRTA